MSMATDPLRIRTFYVLDFDRCIGDTARFHTVLEEAIEHVTDIHPADIRKARIETELSGGSFDTAKYVMRVLESTKSSVSWDDICSEMIKRACREDMLEPHARDLLRILNERRACYGILTYGGEAWQRAKITASRLESVPYLITDMHAKGQVLASWQQPDGTFVIPPGLAGERSLIADSLVLIDDKAASFQDIPLGVRGFHVVWSDRELLPSQAGKLPPGVITAHGMIGVIELLFGLDSVNVVDKA